MQASSDSVQIIANPEPCYQVLWSQQQAGCSISPSETSNGSFELEQAVPQKLVLLAQTDPESVHETWLKDYKRRQEEWETYEKEHPKEDTPSPSSSSDQLDQVNQSLELKSQQTALDEKVSSPEMPELFENLERRTILPLRIPTIKELVEARRYHRRVQRLEEQSREDEGERRKFHDFSCGAYNS